MDSIVCQTDHEGLHDEHERPSHIAPTCGYVSPPVCCQGHNALLLHISLSELSHFVWRESLAAVDASQGFVLKNGSFLHHFCDTSGHTSFSSPLLSEQLKECGGTQCALTSTVELTTK